MDLKAFVILALACHVVRGQVTPPSPVDAVTKLIKAYAAYQSGKGDTEIDIAGTTDWYRRYFINHSSLKMDYFLTPPTISSSTKQAKGVRLSTMMCPWTPFPYDCQLDDAVIHGSASASTHNSQWNVGATTKHTWMFGVEFLGTGGKVGPVAQFSFNWAGRDDTTDAATSQSTASGMQRLTLSPQALKCFEIASYMDKATQHGTSKMQAVFMNYVGFHNDKSTTWQDDQESHYYRLRHIWDIARSARAAGLPEANGWDYDWSSQFDLFINFSNTFDYDFFLGSDGCSSHKAFHHDSKECLQMLPEGWDSWLPTNGVTAGTGRKMLTAALQPRLIVRLLLETFRLDTSDAISTVGYSSRRLLKDQAAAAAVNGTGKIVRCPLMVNVGTNTSADAVDQFAAPTCSGAGLVKYRQDLAQQIADRQLRDRWCLLTVLNGVTSNKNSTLLFGPNIYIGKGFAVQVERKGRQCKPKPTPQSEILKREAEKKKLQAQGSVTPQVGEPQDFYSKLQRLVQAVCYYESKANCDVDSYGITDWYKQYFSDHPAVSGVVGSDDIKMDEVTKFSATSSSWFCQYNADAKSLCQARSTDMSSKAHTTAHTTTWNVQFKLGFKVKAQVSLLDIGPTAEYETENTVDWGYSFSDGSSTTSTDGTSTTATVRLPLTQEMNSCGRITLVTRKASANGATRAWVCADGWVGTHQDPARNWPDIDKTSGETHNYRAATLAYIINFAQKNRLMAGDAFDWYVDSQGRGCLSNAVDMSFDQGVMSFAKPQLFDKDSPECSPSALGLGPAELFPASAQGVSPEEFVYAAVPIPGRQNITTPCVDFANCGI